MIFQAVFASKVEKVNGDLKVTREVDGGLETIKVSGQKPVDVRK